MFLIPYTYKKKVSLYPVHIIHVFLNQGTVLLHVDTNINEFCETNGFIIKKQNIIDDKCYIELDPATDIESFYTYHENSDAECFRRFICIGNSAEDYLNINSTNPAFILPVLEEVLRLSA